jgi:hypothetical protein
LSAIPKEWREVVQEIDAERVWEKYPPKKPHGTRDAFYREELGAPEPMLTQLKEAQQLMAHGGDRKSAKVQLQLGGDRKPTNSDDQVGDTKLIGHTAPYYRARLERDVADAKHPEKQAVAQRLLPRVESGEISAHAAAIEAGFRQRLVQVAPRCFRCAD